MSKYNHKKMLRDINKIVNSDWAFDIDCLAMHPEREITQEVAWQMQKAIGDIYSIAHCTTCSTCRARKGYTTSPKTKEESK